MVTVKKQTIEELLKAWRAYRASTEELLNNLKAKFKVRRQLKEKDRQNFYQVWDICKELEKQADRAIYFDDFFNIIQVSDLVGDKAEKVIYQVLELIGVQLTEQD